MTRSPFKILVTAWSVAVLALLTALPSSAHGTHSFGYWHEDQPHNTYCLPVAIGAYVHRWYWHDEYVKHTLEDGTTEYTSTGTRTEHDHVSYTFVC